MRHWLRRYMPTEETLRAHPSLRWLGPLLRRPWLWHLNRRRVALGAGIGVFFGFMIPVAQIFGAALLALMLRANLPVAAMSTLVSNPFTYAPIFVLAYRTGAYLLGERVDPRTEEVLAESIETPDIPDSRWYERVASVGKPLFVGLAVFGVIGGVIAWASVHVLWTLGVWIKRKRRRRRGRQQA
ncbi:MAG: DUF2062 domain-containing protein [Thiotrichales bacterium]